MQTMEWREKKELILRKARTRFSHNPYIYFSLVRLFDSDNGSPLSIQKMIRLLNASPCFIQDIVDILLDAVSPPRQFTPDFLSCHFAHVYRTPNQKAHSSLSLMDFISAEYIASLQGLSAKREALFYSNTLGRRREFRPLLLTLGTKTCPILRIVPFPRYVTTVLISTSVQSDETLHLVATKELFHKEEEEAVEETVFFTIQQFGPLDIVFHKLSSQFHLTILEVQQLCSQSALLQLPRKENLNLTPTTLVRNTSNPSLLVETFTYLFCPTCFLFDCRLHGANHSHHHVSKMSSWQHFNLKGFSERPSTQAFAFHCKRMFPSDSSSASKLLKLFDPDSSDSSPALFDSLHFPTVGVSHIVPRKKIRPPLRTAGCFCGTVKDCMFDTKCPCRRQNQPCTRETCQNCAQGCGNISMSNTRLIVAFSTIHHGGWGCFANQFIPAKCFISHYCGEIIDRDESSLRSELYDCASMSYLFEMGKDRNGSLVDLDAYRRGSMIKFVNDAKGKRANCEMIKMYHNGNLSVCLFAKRDIVKGEELCFDYGHKFPLLKS